MFIEIIFELVIELLIWLGGEFVFEGLASYFGFASEPETDSEDDLHVSSGQRWTLLFVLGVFVGVVSALILPASIIQRPYTRFAGLILTPVSVGLLSHFLAKLLSYMDREPRLFRDFFSGAAFAFGIVVYRYIVTF